MWEHSCSNINFRSIDLKIALYIWNKFLHFVPIGKPTHRFVRETNDEDEGRTNKIKELLSQFYGGSTSQSQPPSTQPDSSSPYQPGSSNYPDPSTSPLVETPAGPESYWGTAFHSGWRRKHFLVWTSVLYVPSQYQKHFPKPNQYTQYQNQIPQSMNHFLILEF